MNTYFAPAERTDKKKLIEEIELVNSNPVLSGLLHSISGLLAVLDENRQIVAVNDSFLEMLGISDSSETLGLRPGESLNCVHAYEEPGGCGTSKYCSTCGAAIAIVSSLGTDKPVERICALTASRGGRSIDIALLVRSHPIIIENHKFLLLFLQDVTIQQQRAALERTFFHDVNNMLSGLIGASEVLATGNVQPSLIAAIHQSSLRLRNEVGIQRCLLKNDSCSYQPLWQKVTVRDVVAELRFFYDNHPAAKNRNLQFEESLPKLSMKTDMSLLLRVLCNMITNALEATPKSGTVRFWQENNGDSLVFCVWNSRQIPQDIARRVFQRNFSTKEGAGRGVGTYSMKLFGEDILGGKVRFITSDEGTRFTFSLPL